jgi:hypothetical protein
VAGYESFDTNRVKHMEMIQAVVARLAGNSFLIEGWALTLTGAFLGFAVNENDAGLAAGALVPILVFWMLDTYYLRAERLFRLLYDRVRTRPDAVDPFFMGATRATFVASVSADISSWRKTIWRLTLSGFYALLIVATVLVVTIILID